MAADAAKHPAHEAGVEVQPEYLVGAGTVLREPPTAGVYLQRLGRRIPTAGRSPGAALAAGAPRVRTVVAAGQHVAHGVGQASGHADAGTGHEDAAGARGAGLGPRVPRRLFSAPVVAPARVTVVDGDAGWEGVDTGA